MKNISKKQRSLRRKCRVNMTIKAVKKLVKQRVHKLDSLLFTQIRLGFNWSTAGRRLSLYVTIIMRYSIDQKTRSQCMYKYAVIESRTSNRQR